MPLAAEIQLNDITERVFDDLLNTYTRFYSILVEWCKIIREYLSAFEDEPYLLLAEYISRWNAYVAATLELKEMSESLENRINQLYHKFFSNCPQNPKFTIWRLMVCFEGLFVNRILNNRVKYGLKRSTSLAVCQSF